MVFNVRFERQYFLSFQNMQDFDAFLFILLEGGLRVVFFCFGFAGGACVLFIHLLKCVRKCLNPKKYPHVSLCSQCSYNIITI